MNTTTSRIKDLPHILRMNIPIPANQASLQALLAIASNRDRYFSVILDRAESYAYEDSTQLLGVTPQRIRGTSFGSMP